MVHIMDLIGSLTMICGLKFMFYVVLKVEYSRIYQAKCAHASAAHQAVESC